MISAILALAEAPRGATVPSPVFPCEWSFADHNTVLIYQGEQLDKVTFRYDQASGQLLLNDAILLPAHMRESVRCLPESTYPFKNLRPYQDLRITKHYTHEQAASHIGSLIAETIREGNRIVEACRATSTTLDSARAQVRRVIQRPNLSGLFDQERSLKEDCGLCLFITGQDVPAILGLVAGPSTSTPPPAARVSLLEATAYVAELMNFSAASPGEPKMIVIQGGGKTLASGAQNTERMRQQIEASLAAGSYQRGPVPRAAIDMLIQKRGGR